MESVLFWLFQQNETENIQSIMTMAVEFWAGEGIIGLDCLISKAWDVPSGEQQIYKFRITVEFIRAQLLQALCMIWLDNKNIQIR